MDGTRLPWRNLCLLEKYLNNWIQKPMPTEREVKGGCLATSSASRKCMLCTLVCSPARPCVEDRGQHWDAFPQLVLPCYFETGSLTGPKFTVVFLDCVAVGWSPHRKAGLGPPSHSPWQRANGGTTRRAGSAEAEIPFLFR